MESGDPSRPCKHPVPENYPSSGIGAIPLLDHVLRPLIEQEGPLPFPRFMELALYHGEHGYYSNPARTRIGRTGDFATSVSVGQAFGRLLAVRLHQAWEAHGRPASLPVLELGPEDGSLALDILQAARRRDADFHRALHYTVCEHNARKREALAARFSAAQEARLDIVASPADHRAERGVILANEVLDALPVHLVRSSGGAWNERLVTLENDSLSWTETPVPGGDLQQHLATLPSDLPDGYSTEVCLQLGPFFRELAGVFEDALFLFIDYGFEREDYYHPDRTEGTLQTYAHHQAGDDPLDAPGQRDLTTHLDFTRVREAAAAAGLQSLGSARQESYLVHLARDILSDLSPEGSNRDFLRQFQTLTHPAFFGSRFHVLEFAKGATSSGLSFPCPA